MDADLSPTPGAKQRPPTPDEISSLATAVRGMLIQAKARHRRLAGTSDHGRLAVLFTLAQTGPLRASALAKETALDLSTVSRHLRTLEEEGYVDKTSDPEDKRAFFVGLSAQGKSYVQDSWLDRVNQIHTCVGHWHADDVRNLTDLLTRFVSDTEGCIT